MDHTKELAEIALQYIEIVVRHTVVVQNDQNILSNETEKIDNILRR